MSRDTRNSSWRARRKPLFAPLASTSRPTTRCTGLTATRAGTLWPCCNAADSMCTAGCPEMSALVRLTRRTKRRRFLKTSWLCATSRASCTVRATATAFQREFHPILNILSRSAPRVSGAAKMQLPTYSSNYIRRDAPPPVFRRPVRESSLTALHGWLLMLVLPFAVLWIPLVRAPGLGNLTILDLTMVLLWGTTLLQLGTRSSKSDTGRPAFRIAVYAFAPALFGCLGALLFDPRSRLTVEFLQHAKRFGLDILIERARKRQPIYRQSGLRDLMLPVLLLLTALSGMVVHVLRYAGLGLGADYAYAVHLMIAVPMLLVEIPFGGSSHMMYRPLALYFAAVKERALDAEMTLEEKTA